MQRRTMPLQGRAGISLACAALMLLTACGDGGGSNVAHTVCSKLIDCDLARSDEYDKCISTLRPVMQYIIDVDQVVSCINGKSCATLKAGGAKAVQSCFDHDNSSFKCNGDSLHFCNKAGTCKDVNCHDLCADVGRKFNRCAMSTSQGHPVCRCS